MSIWAYKFGKKGVNLSSENSFRFKITNASNSPFTLNLFNLGGGASTQTNFTTATYSIEKNVDLTGIISFGVVTAPLLLQISQGVTILYSGNFIVGQTLANIMTAVNPLVNTQGQSGTFNIQQSVGDLTGNFYDIVVTTPNVSKVDFNGGSVQYTPTYFTTSYVTNNPFIFINGTTDVNFIQNSETTNSLKIIGVDVYSSNDNQLMQGLNYLIRDVNGNLLSFGTDPVIDPYQPNRASLQNIYVDDIQIHTNTQFQYTIDANTTAYITFNYVRFGVAEYEEFNRIFTQQTRDRYLAQRFIVDVDRVQEMNIE